MPRARAVSLFRGVEGSRVSYDNIPEQAGWLVYRVGQGILVEGDKVLLSGNRWHANEPLAWTLPGGRAEDGEGVAQATAREFKEETGLDVEVLGLAYVAEARSTTLRRLFLTCAFVVRRVSGELTHEGDPAVEDLRFVSPAELDAYLPNPSLGNPLRHHLAHHTGPATYWFFPEYQRE